MLDPTGLPLDVGQTQRTVPPAIWLAALVRDRECVAEGCHQPPEHCEAHHIKPFSEGGDTSLANTALFCFGASGHHHQVHDLQRVIRTKTGRLIGPHGYEEPGSQQPDREEPDSQQPDSEEPDSQEPGNREGGGQAGGGTEPEAAKGAALEFGRPA